MRSSGICRPALEGSLGRFAASSSRGLRLNQIEEFVDDRQKSWCIHCGRPVDDLKTNGDHAPSRCLLNKPYPSNLPEVVVHEECNRGFSLDEEYLATFLSCVLSGSTDPDRQSNPRAAGTLRHSPKLRAEIERSKVERVDPNDGPVAVWTPSWDRVHKVIVKNARGHAFFEYGEPMLPQPTNVWAAPLALMSRTERKSFENIRSTVWPEVGSRMLTRVVSGQNLSGPWVVVQPNAYRYTVAQNGGLMVRSVLSEYLATEVRWDWRPQPAPELIPLESSRSAQPSAAGACQETRRPRIPVTPAEPQSSAGRVRTPSRIPARRTDALPPARLRR